MKSLIPFILITVCFCVGAVYADDEEDVAPDLSHQPIVDQITIKGLSRTKEYVVRRELTFHEGSRLTGDELLESIERLRNTELFSRVLPYLQPKPNNHVDITFELDEKWTTIPFFSLTQGGDSLRFSTGAYDLNTFGRFLFSGAGYENWNGEHGGFLWFRDPRFLNKRLTLSMELWNAHRARNLYLRDGTRKASYVLRHDSIEALIDYEWNWWFNTGIGMEYRANSFASPRSEPDLAPDLYQQIHNDKSVEAHPVSITIDIGRLNYDNYLIKGYRSHLLLERTLNVIDSNNRYSRFYWDNSAHWRFPFQSNLSLHAVLAATSSDRLQNLYFVGGLSDVRGYTDGQFRDAAFWAVNIEYRIPSVRTRWLVLQHIFFADAVSTANSLSQLTLHQDAIYPSVGIGLRIISPKIYRFNGRGDLALPLRKTTASPLSIGSQQFF